MKTVFLLILSLSQTSWATETPKKVISLSPALTELVFALGFGDRLIGVSEFSDFPEAAKKIKSVGPYTKPKIETIVALKPDLIFIPLEGPEDVRKHLDQLHLHYTVISMRKIDEIGLAAEKIAQSLGRGDSGKTFKAKWNESLKILFSQPPQKNKTVLIEVQMEPLIVAGTETFLDEIVSRCGGTNIIKEKGYPRLPLELTAVKDLDLVFLADFFSSESDREAATKSWTTRKHPPKQIVVLDPDITSRPGPRLLKGVEKICTELRGAI